MKTRTEIILIILKYLAIVAAIGFSIECGSQLLYFIGSFINPEWAGNVYGAEAVWSRIHEVNTWNFIGVMSLIISISALEAWVWYLIFDLLQKLELKSPFSMVVTKKLETTAHLLLGVWVLGVILVQTYAHHSIKALGLELPRKYVGDEYIFIAGIVYIVSKIFRRGIELQEENQLTV